MSKPPEKIWVESTPGCPLFSMEVGGTQYIRADLLEKIQVLFEELIEFADNSNECGYGTLSTSLVKTISEKGIERTSKLYKPPWRP